MKFLFDGEQQLADAEQAHNSNDKAHTFDKLVDSHRKAHAAGNRIDADRGNCKAGGERHHGLDRRRASHSDKACEREKIDREIFGGAKRQRDLSNPGGEKSDQPNADKRAEGRGPKRGRQSRGRSAIARHRIAIEGGSNR